MLPVHPARGPEGGLALPHPCPAPSSHHTIFLHYFSFQKHLLDTNLKSPCLQVQVRTPSPPGSLLQLECHRCDSRMWVSELRGSLVRGAQSTFLKVGSGSGSRVVGQPKSHTDSDHITGGKRSRLGKGPVFVPWTGQCDGCFWGLTRERDVAVGMCSVEWEESGTGSPGG